MKKKIVFIQLCIVLIISSVNIKGQNASLNKALEISYYNFLRTVPDRWKDRKPKKKVRRLTIAVGALKKAKPCPKSLPTCNNHATESRGGSIDFFHFQTGHGQKMFQFVGRKIRIGLGFQP